MLPLLPIKILIKIFWFFPPLLLRFSVSHCIVYYIYMPIDKRSLVYIRNKIYHITAELFCFSSLLRFCCCCCCFRLNFWANCSKMSALFRPSTLLKPKYHVQFLFIRLYITIYALCVCHCLFFVIRDINIYICFNAISH